ncbi:hypothetical protein BJ878DRAFT_274473 [Calycina marina]|uniref:BTB domain-containing protein n=1 Tax=Calycina marina TaxID=1763456 RepID=A0A9P7Z7B1_9HELO|nr:hypothetical protein BJ878DRAFT_274473 [Calycina marina]
MISRSIAIKQEPDEDHQHVRSQEPGHERLMVDELGWEMVVMRVGTGGTAMSAHKSLLVNTSPRFAQAIDHVIAEDREITFSEETPEMMKIFMEFLYTKRVPTVHEYASPIDQSSRIKNLCKMYIFAEKYYMHREIRNRVMDVIQDGFLIINSFPTEGVAANIFEKTSPTSSLRRFVSAALLYSLRHSANEDKSKGHHKLADLLVARPQVLENFLQSVQDLNLHTDRDPRVRDCTREPGCAECLSGIHKAEPCSGGVWPCEFHVHASAEDQEDIDQRCYLWLI